MKTLILVLALMLTACTAEQPGPVVYLRWDGTHGMLPASDAPTWSAEQKAWALYAARQWEQVGFGPFLDADDGIDDSIPEIDPSVTHYDGAEPGYIVVTVHQDDALAIDGHAFAGLHPDGSREIFVNAILWDPSYGHQFEGTITHELGHLLLHATGHLQAPGVGVMNATPSGHELTPDDLAFACETAGRCQ